MKQHIVPGSTDQSIIVFLQDDREVDGSGLTGLAHDTASLVCYYVRPGSAAAQLSLVTQTVTGAHGDGGFVEIDSTNMPGFYRLDLPDVMVASGVDSVALMIRGAANLVGYPAEIQLSRAPADATAISGDTTAADNLEAMLDGTGGADLTLRNLRIAGNHVNGAIYVTNAHQTGDGIRVHMDNDGYPIWAHLVGNIYGTISTVTTVTGVAEAGRQAIADEVLKRDVSNVEASAAEHSLCTIVLATLESAIGDTTWTIKRTDGNTTHATKTVTVNPEADPISGVSG